MSRMPKDERREQLLDAARSLVLKGGFHAVTMAAVAEMAGVTRPLVYAQFGDLGALARALAERESHTAFVGFTSAVSGVDASLPLLDAVAEGTRALLAVVRAAPETWHVVLEPPQGGPPELYEAIGAGHALGLEAVTRTLGRAVSSVPDRELTARILRLAGHELMRLHLLDEATYPEERIIAQITSLVARLLDPVPVD